MDRFPEEVFWDQLIRWCCIDRLSGHRLVFDAGRYGRIAIRLLGPGRFLEWECRVDIERQSAALSVTWGIGRKGILASGAAVNSSLNPSS